MKVATWLMVGCIAWETSLGSVTFCRGTGETVEGDAVKPLQVGLLEDVWQSLKLIIYPKGQKKHKISGLITT